MKPRLNYATVAPGTYEAMDALDRYLQTCELEISLIMHWKDLCAIGEHEQRLYSLDAWRECPYYTDRERAALEWTEAVTLITTGHVPDAVYEHVRSHFSEKELSDLTLTVATINAWNRLSIAGRLTPGTYQPAQATA